MSADEYVLLVGAACAVMGGGVILFGVWRLSAAVSLRRPEPRNPESAASTQAGCAGAVIILAGSVFLLGGLAFLVAGLVAL